MGGIAKFYSDGGAWMHPILVVSIVCLAIVIERMIALYFKYGISASTFMAQIQKLVMANNIDRAIKLCNSQPSAALPRVMKAGLTRANKGPEEIQNAVEEATLEIVPLITKRATMLPSLANIATLLGLLGTILGLITAFGALSDPSIPPDKRQALLSNGISIAMNTTAMGLFVAIPSLFIQLFISAKVKGMIEELDQYSVKLENLLISRLHGAAGPQA